MKHSKRFLALLVPAVVSLLAASTSYAQIGGDYLVANSAPVTTQFTDDKTVTFTVANLNRPQQFVCYAPPPMNGKPPAGIKISAHSNDARLMVIGANQTIITRTSDAMIIRLSPMQHKTTAHIQFTVEDKNINLQEANLSITCAGHNL